MKKRMLSLLLCFVMLLGLMPTAAWSATPQVTEEPAPLAKSDGKLKIFSDEPTSYDLNIGGRKVTSANCNDVFEDGTTRFDPSTRTLYLNDTKDTERTSLFEDYLGNRAAAFIFTRTSDLTISVSGTNTFSRGMTNVDNVYGIYCGGELSITGSGTLNIEVTEAGYQACGIFAYGDLSVADTKISASARGGMVDGIGLYPYSDLDLSNYSCHVLVGDNADDADEWDGTTSIDHYACFSVKPIVKYDVWVNGVQFNSDNAVSGIACGSGTAKLDVTASPYTLTLHNASIRNRYVTMKNDLPDVAYGIYAKSGSLDIVLEGENNSIIMPEMAAVYSYGIYVYSSLTVKGSGTLTITGGALTDAARAKWTCGIRASDFENQAVITIANGSSPAYSYGVYAYDFTNVGKLVISLNDAKVCYGIWETEGSVINKSNAELLISGTNRCEDASAETYGIFPRIDNSGEVRVNIDAAVGANAYGIYAPYGMKNSGSLNAGITGAGSTGIYGSITNSGTLIAKGGSCGLRLYGESNDSGDNDYHITGNVILIGGDRALRTGQHASGLALDSGALKGCAAEVGTLSNTAYQYVDGQRELCIAGTKTICKRIESAEVQVTYPVWVNGSQFTEENINGSIPCGSGSASLNISTTPYTLTLHDAAVATPTYIHDAQCMISSDVDLKLVLEGTNTITAPSTAEDFAYGILVDESCELTIEGDGTLTITGGDLTGQYAEMTAGISAGDIVNNAAITVSGGGASDTNTNAVSDGIRCINFENNGSVALTCRNAAGSRGLNCSDSIVNALGASITVTGGSTYGCTNAHTIGINGGNRLNNLGTISVDITADDNCGYHFGIYLYEMLTNSGTISAAAKGKLGTGVYLGYDCGLVSSGTLTAEGGSCGLRLGYEDAEVSGDLTLIGGDRALDCSDMEIDLIETLELMGSTTTDGSLSEAMYKMVGSRWEVCTAGNEVCKKIVTVPAVTHYPVWVNGEQFSERNLSDGIVCGSGTAKLTPPTPYDDSFTLTLDNAEITKVYEGFGVSQSILSEGSLNLVLVGTNTITQPEGAEVSSGILSEAELTINGSGSLYVACAEADEYSLGIIAQSIVNNATVTVYAGDATDESEGVYCSELENNGTLTTFGGEAVWSYGVHCLDFESGTVTNSAGAKLCAYAGDNAYHAYGIRCGKLVNAGTLIASADSRNAADAYGIYTQNDLTNAAGSTLSAEAVGEDGYGIYMYASGTLTNSGTLSAEGGYRGININIGGTFVNGAAASLTVIGGTEAMPVNNRTITIDPSAELQGSASVDGELQTAEIQKTEYDNEDHFCVSGTNDVCRKLSVLPAGERYPVWISGQQFSENRMTILFGSGTATLTVPDDPADPYVLTLNGIDIDAAQTHDINLIQCNDPDNDSMNIHELRIELVGFNRIAFDGAAETDLIGIYAPGADVTIVGVSEHGDDLPAGSLYFDDQLQISIRTSSGGYVEGLHNSRNISLDNACLSIDIESSKWASGIVANDIVLSNDAVLYCNAASTGDHWAAGITSYGNITVNDTSEIYSEGFGKTSEQEGFGVIFSSIVGTNPHKIYFNGTGEFEFGGTTAPVADLDNNKNNEDCFAGSNAPYYVIKKYATSPNGTAMTGKYKNPDSYGVWVNGVEITKSNVSSAIPCGTGTAKLDVSAMPYTLTLDNAQIDRGHYIEFWTNAGIYFEVDLNICLRGENVIRIPADYPQASEYGDDGIASCREGSALTITGEEGASLTILGREGNRYSAAAIRVNGSFINHADIVIDESSRDGICVYYYDYDYNLGGGDFENFGNLDVTTAESSFGTNAIETDGDFTNHGTVCATAAKCKDSNCAIDCGGTLTNNGDLTAIGKGVLDDSTSTMAGSIGICAGTLVNNGILYAEAGPVPEGNNNSYGVTAGSVSNYGYLTALADRTAVRYTNAAESVLGDGIRGSADRNAPDSQLGELHEVSDSGWYTLKTSANAAAGKVALGSGLMVKREDDTLNCIVAGHRQGTAQLIAVQYVNGQMIEMKTGSSLLDLSEGGEASFSFTDCTNAYYKVFLLDSGKYTPVCAAWDSRPA